MKRILYCAILVGLLAGSTAHAGKIISYNPSFGQPIRVLAQWYKGWNTRTITYTYEPCLVVTVNEYAFGVLVNSTVTRFECR